MFFAAKLKSDKVSGKFATVGETTRTREDVPGVIKSISKRSDDHAHACKLALSYAVNRARDQIFLKPRPTSSVCDEKCSISAPNSFSYNARSAEPPVDRYRYTKLWNILTHSYNYIFPSDKHARACSKGHYLDRIYGLCDLAIGQELFVRDYPVLAVFSPEYLKIVAALESRALTQLWRRDSQLYTRINFDRHNTSNPLLKYVKDFYDSTLIFDIRKNCEIFWGRFRKIHRHGGHFEHWNLGVLVLRRVGGHEFVHFYTWNTRPEVIDNVDSKVPFTYINQCRTGILVTPEIVSRAFSLTPEEIW